MKPSRHDACLFDVLYTVPDDAARSVELCLSLSITPGVALAAVDGSDGSGAELSQFTAPTLTVPALRRADTAAASPVGRMVGVVELAVGPAACVAAALDDSVVVVSSPSTHTLTVIDTHSGLILAAMGGRASEPVAVPGLWIGPLGLCFAPPVPVQLAAPGTPAASSTSSSPSRGSVRVLRTAFGTVWSPSAACGDLLVCDCGNNRVVRVTLSGRVVGFVGVGTLVRPWGVAANADVIVVSEPTAGRVVVFQAATGLALSTIGDDGTAAAAGVSPSRCGVCATPGSCAVSAMVCWWRPWTCTWTAVAVGWSCPTPATAASVGSTTLACWWRRGLWSVFGGVVSTPAQQAIRVTVQAVVGQRGLPWTMRAAVEVVTVTVTVTVTVAVAVAVTVAPRLTSLQGRVVARVACRRLVPLLVGSCS